MQAERQTARQAETESSQVRTGTAMQCANTAANDDSPSMQNFSRLSDVANLASAPAVMRIKLTRKGLGTGLPRDDSKKYTSQTPSGR